MKRFAIFISLIILLALSAVALAGDEKQSLSGAEIVSKHLAAVGGKEAIMRIKSRVAIGVAKKDNDAAVPVYVVSEAPNRVSATYQFEGYNWQMAYDGKQSVVRPVLTRANAPVMQKYQDMLASGTMFNGISLYNALLESDDSGIKFEAKGTKKVKNRSAYVVEMRRPKGDIVRLYFDAENFMWLRSDYGTVRLTKEMGTFTNSVESKDQEVTYDFYIETTDFKEVDGVKLPFKFEIVATAPILKQKNVGTIITNITEYRHNIPINPKMFQ